MIHIYHHNDADGRLAAAVVAFSEERKALIAGWGPLDPGALRFVECAYGPAPSFDEVSAGDTVYVVDYSFADADFARLREKAGKEGRVVWYDHHASAASSAHSDLPGLRCFQAKGPAGCLLAWIGEFGTAAGVPLFVEYVSDYDSWRHRYPESVAFYEATKAGATQATPEGWLDWLRRDPDCALRSVEDMVRQGATILRYRDGYLANLRKTAGYSARLSDAWPEFYRGLVVPAVNAPQFGSAALGAGLLASVQIGLAYLHDGTEFVVSIYSEQPDVDCGALAKTFGGGGHRGAAGFRCTALPWTREGSWRLL